MKRKSTVTNLVEATSSFIYNMEAGYQTDVVYTDFSKAFDLLPHSVILLKLKKLGFPKYFIKWTNSYLTDRSYSVIFRTSESIPFEASSGVPQGSHLGPLLFIIAVNDVKSVLANSDLRVYADDMKIFKKITSVKDCEELQFDLNNFFTWCCNNNLFLNVDKCAFMRFTRRTNPIAHSYTLNNQIISNVTSIKDLGVCFDEKLTFRHHFSNIINKANSMLGFIKRWSREFKDPYTLKALYTCLVRPNLEYASQVWSPHYETTSLRIEAVQKNFLRFALRNLPWQDPIILPPYECRLNLIKLTSLKNRREMADVVFIFQVINGSIVSSFISDKIIFSSYSRSRSNDLFSIIFHRTNYGKYEPINRMLLLGNKYKSIIDLNASKDMLKKSIFNFQLLAHN